MSDCELDFGPSLTPEDIYDAVKATDIRHLQEQIVITPQMEAEYRQWLNGWQSTRWTVGSRRNGKSTLHKLLVEANIPPLTVYTWTPRSDPID